MITSAQSKMNWQLGTTDYAKKTEPTNGYEQIKKSNLTSDWARATYRMEIISIWIQLAAVDLRFATFLLDLCQFISVLLLLVFDIIRFL